MKKLITTVLAAVALLTAAGAAGASSTGSATGSGTGPDPRPDTIVRVEGDAANGFGVHFHDGSAIYPPTDSEARAECGEYDTMRARVRCRTETRTWYRDLADLQQSLEWALSQ